jgi:hypothetical protein
MSESPRFSHAVQSHGPGAASATLPRWPVVVFAGTVLLSAFLLFQVQPLISKFILPWFGGAPAVWTTCMLFFQVALFAGYSFAHLAGSRLSLRAQAVVQGVLLLAALAVLPIVPSAAWKPLESEAPTWRILLLLLATVGLPYFVLSTTSPLALLWFSRVYPDRSPYRLYALSNFGSLAALLSYPFLFEPALDLSHQAWLWSGAFAAYVLLFGGCAAWMLARRASDPLAQVGDSGVPAAKDGSPDGCARNPGQGNACPARLHRLWWVLLPACASLMLLATTNHVCQDVAVAPFLWVAPLALYLLSFIVCFDHQRWYVRGLWAGLVAIAVPVTACVGQLAPWFGYNLGFREQLAVYFSTMFCICMVCHGELVRLRPDPRHLTQYYLLISLGGALGGVLVSLIAPQVFSTYLEWDIGLVVSYMLALAVLVLANARPGSRPAWNLAAVLAPPLAVILVLYWQSGNPDLRETVRNFYGIVAVYEVPGSEEARRHFKLTHGRILHGHQFADPPESGRATLYHRPDSGIARAIEFAGRRGPVRVGVVGLGAGVLAAYARSGDCYLFYEINPAVPPLAETYFTYLRDARLRDARVGLVMGDARLSLENQEDQRFDVLALDAFSGDSVPTHLLTREAFEIYLRHLAPRGILAVHITNRSLCLAPVVRGMAEHFGLAATRIYIAGRESGIAFRSDWMLLSYDPGLLRALPASPPPDAREDFDVPLWTDQYSNLFQILQR